MADIKTKPTKASVAKFIAGVENDTRRADARTLLKVFKEATGWKPRMLGPTIVGFVRGRLQSTDGEPGVLRV